MVRIPQHLIDWDARQTAAKRALAEDRDYPARRPAEDELADAPVSFRGPAITERQIPFVQSLYRERDLTGLSPKLRALAEQVARGELISFSAARRLLDHMTKLPKLPDDRRPASPGQLGFIRDLAGERGMNPTEQQLAGMTFGVASSMITRLLRMRKSVNGITEDGIYRTPDGTVYKVQVAYHGNGQLYGKRLVEVEPGVWKFVRDEGALARLAPSMLMSLEEAIEFGRLYHVCVRCGAILTDEDSIEAGIGPICRQYF